jgi:hypothetical protein
MINSTLSTAPPSPSRILHDMRAIADVVQVDLTAVGLDPAVRWAVLRTSPQPHSGSATLMDAVMDGATGRTVGLIDSRRAPFEPVIIREGDWRVVSVLSGEAPADRGRYSWAEPQRVFTRRQSRTDIYDPFALPATILCRFEPAAAPSFHEVSVLPDGWEETATEAVAAASLPSTARLQPSSPAAYHKLLSWLSSPYHLLFSTAISALIRDYALSAETFDKLLAQLNGYRRAVFHYATLSSGHYLGQKRVISSLIRAWTTDYEPDQRRAAALGLLAAWHIAPQAVEIPMSRVRAIITDDDDDYVRRAFELLS